ncbi:MAG: site-specific DNA-methyltransferase [Azospirillum brasilense]|nr:MAG: site-specific DNA-methyltransferase [Azospirillum brasilense]
MDDTAITVLPISADEPIAQSANIVSPNVLKIKEIYPEVFTEGKIDFEVLRDLINDAIDDSDEKYGLSWNGKRSARRFALTPSTGTLLPATAESVRWDTSKNIMIEGDNLEVLKLLQKSYNRSINFIYIDPPYNTGSDFVYPDCYHDSLGNYLRRTGQADAEGVRNTSNPESSGRYHTDWLNMMLPRLMLARGLMAEDGLIAVSVDDDELANLTALMNELFGEENKIACLVWDKNRKNDAKLFSVGHEYMLVYARSLALLRERKIKWREDRPGLEEARQLYESLQVEFADDLASIRTSFLSFYRALDKDDPRKPIGRFTKLDSRGPYRDDGDISWPGGGGPKYEVLHPETQKPVKAPPGGWVYPTAEGFWKAYSDGDVVFGPDETTLPRQIRYLFESEGQVMVSVNFSYAQTATMDLAELMGGRVFDNPKNWADISRLISYFNLRDGIVLDFFAGSGTTAHSVMVQNAAGNRNLRYILVQLPEPLNPDNKDQKAAASFCDKLGKPRNIAELTKERLRRAAARTRADNPKAHFDDGFRVYKLATSNLKAWQPGKDLNKDLLEAANNLIWPH